MKKLVKYIIPTNNILLEKMEKNIKLDENFDTFYLIKNTNFLFNFVKEIELPYQASNTQTFHNNLKKSMLNGDNLVEFIPLSIKFLTDLLFTIWEDKIMIKKSFLKLKNI